MAGFFSPGGSTVQPAAVAYRAVTLAASVVLVWPTQSQTGSDFVARIMDVTPTGVGLSITIGDARYVGNGFDIIWTNAGSFAYNIVGNTGTVLATVSPGQVYYLWLKDDSTQAGTWGSLLFGAGSSSLSAASVAGLGILAIGSTLNENHPVSVTSASPVIISASDRAATYVWSGGTGVFNLPLAGTVGNGFFFHLVNEGTGSVTITPGGGDTIDGSATQVLQPGNSGIVTAGPSANWFSVGRDLAENFNFTELVLSVTGGTTTLTQTQAANVVQKYTGTLTSNQSIVLPPIVQVYYVQNATSGAFTLTFGNGGAGTTISVPSGQNAILFSDGTNVINASTTVSGITSIILAQGSAASPSITYSGDTSTGIFQPVTGTVAVTTSGTERARFTSAGTQSLAFIPNGSTVPATGMYLPATNTVGFASNTALGFQLYNDGVAGHTGFFQADFSNATLANRLYFQDKTTNSSSTLGVLPNGASLLSGFAAFNNSNPTNAAYGYIQATAGSIQIGASTSGTGTALPTDLTYGSGTVGARIQTSGNFDIGSTTTLTATLGVTGLSARTALYALSPAAQAAGVFRVNESAVSSTAAFQVSSAASGTPGLYVIPYSSSGAFNSGVPAGYASIIATGSGGAGTGGLYLGPWSAGAGGISIPGATGNVVLGGSGADPTDYGYSLMLNTGALMASGIQGIGQLNTVFGAASSWYAASFRNDGAGFYLLSSNVSATKSAAASATFNANRPFTYNLTNSAVLIDTGTTGGGVTIGNTRTLTPLIVQQGAYTPTVPITVSTSTLNIDISTSNSFYCLLNTSVTTLNVQNVGNGQSVIIQFRQGGAGSMTVPLNVFSWEGGVVPSLTTTAGALDVVTLTWSTNASRFIASIMKDVR
jgi:hypothetical protein